MLYNSLIREFKTLFGIRDFNSTSWDKSGGLNVTGVADQVFSLCFWTSQWTRTQKGLVRTQILLPVQPYKAESLWREFWVGTLKRSFVFVYACEITPRCVRLGGYLLFKQHLLNWKSCRACQINPEILRDTFMLFSVAVFVCLFFRF